MFCIATCTQAASKYWSGTATWDGASVNWGVTPGGPYSSSTFAAGDDAIFEATAGTVTVSAPNNPLSMTFNTAGYTLSGGTLALNGPTITTIGDATISSVISGNIGLTKNGAGTLILSGANTWTGGTTVSAGKLLINNTTGTGTVSVNSGATLGGTGIITGPVTLVSGATLAPGPGGPGRLEIHSNLSLPSGSTLAVELDGTAAGTQYDQMVDTGTVSLGGAWISLALGYAPATGDNFTIIYNDLSEPINGTFTGLPEGAVITAGYNSIGYKFKVSYAGGTGNDLVLTCEGEDHATGTMQAGPFAKSHSGGFLAGRDSVPLSQVRLTVDNLEDLFVDTLRMKLKKGHFGAISAMRLSRDLDRNGMLSSGDQWLKDTTVNSGDSMIVFNKGIWHLDSVAMNDTLDYVVTMKTFAGMVGPADSFVVTTFPSQTKLTGKSSGQKFTGTGSPFEGDTAWGLSGSGTVTAGDSNLACGKPVITGDDSVAVMHIALSAGAVEGLYIDTLAFKMIRGNRTAISMMRLFYDGDNNGLFNPANDTWFADAACDADSGVLFAKTGHLDSVSLSSVKRYWLVMDLGAVPVTTADTFAFQCAPASGRAHGMTSGSLIKCSGSIFTGCTVPGDVMPSVTNVTSTKSNGFYAAGTVIDVDATFNKAVTVIGGPPQLTMESGTTDRDAGYLGGTGTATLTFRYTVQSGDASGDLDYVSTGALSLSGATIKDANGNSADLMLPAPGASGSLGFNRSIVIDCAAPTAGTMLITDNSGFTNNVTPRIVFSGVSGADSVRYGVNDSAAMGIWRPYAEPDSINIGAPGGKRVYAQFRDFAGNLSAKISDTTVYDMTPPAVGAMSIKVTNGFTMDSDPAIVFTGITGADSVRYGVNDSMAMGAWRVFTSPDSITLGPEGGKRVWAQFRDLAGNQSARINDTTTYDATPPQNVTSLSAHPVSGNRAAFSWVASASGDADSIMIRYSTINFPSDTGSMTFWKTVSAAVAVDTITGLAEKTNYYLGLFVKDKAGNWCATSPGARNTVYMPDITSPLNVNGLIAASVVGKRIALSWNPSVSPDAAVCMIRYSMTGYPADTGSGILWRVQGNAIDRDTIANAGIYEKKGYYIGMFVSDSSGNWSGADVAAQLYVYLPDKTPPDNPVSLVATAVDSNRVRLVWNPSAIAATDVDSVEIWYKTSGYPLSYDDPLAWLAGRYSRGDSTAMVNLSTFVTLYFGLVIRDTSNNRSIIGTDARDTVTGVAKPGPFSYIPVQISATVGIPIIRDTCFNGGGASDSFTIAPMLPTGLGIDRKTGTISGLPVAVSLLTTYWVRAINRAGADSIAILIAVYPKAPGPIHYVNSAVIGTVGVAMRPDTCINAGGPPDRWSIAPPLPQGLDIDTATGVISGTALMAQMPAEYLVTASNTGGAARCTVTVSVFYPRPVASFGAAPLAGAAPLGVQFTDSSTGFISSRQWFFGDGLYDTLASPLHTYDKKGIFPVRLVVYGPGGTDSMVKAALVTVADTTQPLPLVNFQASAVNCSTAVLSWYPSASPDADSIARCVSFTGFPLAPFDGVLRKMLPAGSLGDTLTGLPPGGAPLYASVYVKDSSGNWSPPVRDSLRLPDGVTPANALKVVMASSGDTAILVSWKIDSMQTDANGIGWNCRQGTPVNVPDSTLFNRSSYRDTAFTLYPVKTAGIWYLSTIVRDSSGNLSPLRADSVTVLNKPPAFTAAISDTTVSEDTLWQDTVIAFDWNGDSLHFSLREAPAGVGIDPVSGVLSWTPDDSSVGVNRIVVECGDYHSNGVVGDTVLVTVLNVNEPPSITFAGDSTALEDSVYRATVEISDPDLNDPVQITAAELPSWLTLSKDTLLGTPVNEDVGADTLRFLVTDKAGLTAMLTRILRVVNTNDTPVVQRVVAPAAGCEDSALTMTVFVYDVDIGDSLSFEWGVKPPWLSLTDITFTPERVEWKYTLTGTPGTADTGLVPYSFIVTDRAGSSAQYSGRIAIIDRPNTSIARKQVAGAAACYTLRPANALDTGVTFVTRLASPADTAFTAIDRTIGFSGVVEYYPLVDGIYVFSACAVDTQGLRETGTLVDTLVMTGATTHTFAGDSGRWQMMSVPTGTIEAGPVRGSGCLVTWDESGPERNFYGYYTPSGEVRDLAGGRSYWRLSADTVAIAIDRESLVDSAVTIHLSRAKFGWNMVASPYAYPVAWNSALQAWKWNGTDFEPVTGNVLEPWQGYWVMADSVTAVTLDPRPVWTDSLRRRLTKSTAYFVGKTEWKLKVALSGRAISDCENTIGISAKSSDGFDRTDLYEPPRMPGQGYLFFPHPEWNKSVSEFAGDIRKNWQPVNMFEVGIAPWTGRDSATIRLEGYENLTGICAFVRTEAGTFGEYDAGRGIVLPPSAETRCITVIVTADRGLVQKLPLRFLCGNPYPNPGRSMTRIRYTLPYEWSKDGRLATDAYQVKIVIHDLAGRLIRNLVSRKQAAGSYEVVWNCKMNTGRMVNAGVFMYSIEAGKNRAIKRIMVLR